MTLEQQRARCIYRDMTAAELDRAIDTNAELLEALKATLPTLAQDAVKHRRKGEPARLEVKIRYENALALIAKAEGR